MGTLVLDIGGVRGSVRVGMAFCMFRDTLPSLGDQASPPTVEAGGGGDGESIARVELAGAYKVLRQLRRSSRPKREIETI